MKNTQLRFYIEHERRLKRLCEFGARPKTMQALLTPHGGVHIATFREIFTQLTGRTPKPGMSPSPDFGSFFQKPNRRFDCTVGNHLEPHLLEAMRTLIRESKWKINEDGGRVWYGSDGLYVIWKKAADELSKAIDEKGIRGVPTEANSRRETEHRGFRKPSEHAS